MRNGVARGAFLGLLAVLLALAGCGRRTEPPAVPEPPPQWLVVGVSLCKTDSPWRMQMKADIEAAAAKHPDLRLIVMDAAGRRREAAGPAWRSSWPRRVDVVIVSPKDAQAITDPVAKLFDAGIPVIVLDRAVIGDKYTCFIAADPETDRHGGGQVAGRAASREGQDRGTQGAGRFAAGPRNCTPHVGPRLRDPGYRFVFDGHVDPPKVDAGKLMTEALGHVEKIDAVFAYDDAAAHAAYQTAKAAGREKGVLFVGVGGLPAEGAAYVSAGHSRRHVSESDRRGRGRRRRREASPRREGAQEDRAPDAGDHQRSTFSGSREPG